MVVLCRQHGGAGGEQRLWRSSQQASLAIAHRSSSRRVWIPAKPLWSPCSPQLIAVCPPLQWVQLQAGICCRAALLLRLRMQGDRTLLAHHQLPRTLPQSLALQAAPIGCPRHIASVNLPRSLGLNSQRAAVLLPPAVVPVSCGRQQTSRCGTARPAAQQRRTATRPTAAASRATKH